MQKSGKGFANVACVAGSAAVLHTASLTGTWLVREGQKESQEETNPGGAGSTVGKTTGRACRAFLKSRYLVKQINQSDRIDPSQEIVPNVVVLHNLKVRYHHINICGLT